MKHGSEAEEKVYELEKQVGFIVRALSLDVLPFASFPFALTGTET